jgi:Flp pilus assembly protein TadG
MSIASKILRLRNSASRFIHADKGNVAVIFAIASLPIFGLVGAAVDYTRVSNARASMQSALDSTALMLSKDLASGIIKSGDIDAKAKSYFAGLYTNTNATVVPGDIHAAYTAKDAQGYSTIAVSSSASMTTDFLKLAGFPQIGFTTNSTATWGNSRLRVALALDNTGSMADDGKMVALIPAAKNLIDQLKATSANTGDVYVSIIPFSRDVNVGASNYNQTWVDWSDWDPANASCSGNNGNWYTSQSSCQQAGRTWTVPNHNTWNGCVADRDQNYDISNTAPTSNSSTKFPADQYDACPVSLMPLSYDWTALKAKIDTFTPNGNTNQAIGLAWAWQSLTSSAPLNAPPLETGFTYQKIIILMTDGLNTQNRWTTNASTIDARQRLMCDAIKADGVKIFAIQVNTSKPADPTQAVLQYCASGDSNFYQLYSATQLLSTFQAIGTSLSKLRLKS